MVDETGRNLLEKAHYLIEVARWKEAIPLLLKVLAQDPQHFQTNCMLSLCHFHLKKFENALEFAQTAVSNAPDEEWGHRLRSNVLIAMGRNNEALVSAEEAARLAPYEPFALLALTDAYLALRKTKKAEATALKLIELAPDLEYSHFMLGNVFIQKRSYSEAEDCFREALRINPGFADARNNLGVAILRRRQRLESTHSSELSILQNSSQEIHWHFTEAVKLEPENEFAAMNLRGQFDPILVLYSFIFFLPFTLLAFFVFQLMGILIAGLIIYVLLQELWKVAQNRKNLTPELKMFLKASSHTKIANRFREFLSFIRRFYQNTWKPHLLALSAVGVRHLDLIAAGKYIDNWNNFAALILILASFIWLLLTEITQESKSRIECWCYDQHFSANDSCACRILDWLDLSQHADKLCLSGEFNRHGTRSALSTIVL